MLGRLANVFLDYTYRDLSVEANRRYFITAERKPAASSATLTSGIIYLPMDDPATAHINLGTGGNMTPNGVIARSGRGPNQTNVPYSDLAGAADYLSRTSLTGAADSSAITFAFSVNVFTILSFNSIFEAAFFELALPGLFLDEPKTLSFFGAGVCAIVLPPFFIFFLTHTSIFVMQLSFLQTLQPLLGYKSCHSPFALLEIPFYALIDFL
jgi:hypothetical protein